jgi:hypothetical protein
MKDSNQIKSGMDVICSCGQRFGKVSSLIGTSIKLDSSDAATGNKVRYLPTEWVDRVDRRVYLNKNSQEVDRQWSEELLAL